MTLIVPEVLLVVARPRHFSISGSRCFLTAAIVSGLSGAPVSMNSLTSLEVRVSALPQSGSNEKFTPVETIAS